MKESIQMKKETSSASGAAEKPEEKKEPAHHVLEIVTNLINEKTGEEYIDLDSMKKILDTRKSIKKYAWIIHDKDVYVAEDIANAEASGKKEIPELGSPKAAHVHCVMYLNPAQTISTIAKWFNVKPQQIQLARYDSGEDFLAKVEYITHEAEKQQALGKHLYSDKDVHSNFDFRKELSERKENKEKYGTATPGKKLKNRIDVLSYGKSLREIADEDIIAYNDDMDKLKKNRIEYLNLFCPMPKVRLNFYIEGCGGVGKGLASRALARALVDKDGNMTDEAIFFEVGADNVTFEGYDGQPVIIWNDCRCDTLFFKLGGRENVFNAFDPFPPNIKQNIKYGSVKLVNSINIVNSVQSWSVFLDGLAGEYLNKKTGKMEVSEDKGQSYRRFPFVISLHENNYDLFVNKGVSDGTRDYMNWFVHTGILGNFQRVSERCGNDDSIRNKINNKILKIVTDNYNTLYNNLYKESSETEEEILNYFSDYGTTVDINNDELFERFKNFIKNKPAKDAVDLFNEFVETYQVDLSFEQGKEFINLGIEIKNKEDNNQQ